MEGIGKEGDTGTAAFHITATSGHRKLVISRQVAPVYFVSGPRLQEPEVVLAPSSRVARTWTSMQKSDGVTLQKDTGRWFVSGD